MIDHKAMDTAKKHGLWWEIVLDAVRDLVLCALPMR